MSALKTGSGLVTVGIPASINSIIQMKLTEAITIPLEDEGTGVLAYPSINKIIEKMDKVDVLVFGPGLSNCYSIRLIMEQIIKNSQIPVIIDADGINALAQNINILKQSKCPIILTPHPGEMSRLTGLSVDVIQANRVNIAQSLARDWNVTLVLKGAHTVIACADGTVYINLNGNPGMATAGMGDVLSGVIASLVGQGIGISQSTIAGVFIHGHTGDIVADRKGKYGLTAMDVVEALPEALKRLAPS
jgi:NAD(P)H-hydrate epimerase